MDPIFDSVPKSRLKRFKQYIRSLDDLYAYYPLDEPSGAVINRAPATFGTLNGTLVNAERNVNGLLGKSVHFDGSGDYISTFSKTILLTSSYSFFVLLKTLVPPVASDDDYFGVIHEGGANDPSIGAGLTHTNGYFKVFLRADNSNSQTVTWNVNIADGEWHLLTFVRDVSNDIYQAYSDGVALGAGITDTINSSQTLASVFYLGANNIRGTVGSESITTLQHFGWVDGVLSPAQILKMAKIAGLA